jgi:hypothetical protein
MALLTPSTNLEKWFAILILFGLGTGLLFHHPALLSTFHAWHTKFPAEPPNLETPWYAEKVLYYIYLCYERQEREDNNF